MEATLKAEDTLAVSHQHASGEVFSVNNLEAARGMCPVLGKMSLEEAGLLLELEALGKEPVVASPDLPQDKPEIVKIDEVRPEVTEGKKPVQLVLKNIEAAEVAPIETLEQLIDEAVDEESFEVQRHETFLRQTEPQPVRDDESENEPTLKQNVTPVEETASVNRPEIYVAATLPETQIAETERPQQQDTPISRELTPAVVETEPLIKRSEKGLEQAQPEKIEPVQIVAAQDVEVATRIDLPEPIEAEETEPTETPLKTVTAPQLAEDEPMKPTQMEVLTIATPELPAPVTQIETAMTQLVEIMDAPEAKEPRKILEEIISLPSKLEAMTSIEPEMLEAQLEELFVELFEETNITYSPELISSFIKLTKMHHLEALLEIAEIDEEIPGLPTEIGTREFLQKLQRGLGTMQQAVTSFNGIGQSVLRLCDLEGLALLPAKQ